MALDAQDPSAQLPWTVDAAPQNQFDEQPSQSARVEQEDATAP
jgi:hypothetical protein